MIHRYLIGILLCGLCAFALTGCPSSAYIEAYNNTPTVLTIGASDLEKGVKLNPGQTARLRFGGHYFKVKSDLGTWYYPRNMPHVLGEGPYYDGILRIQIDPDDVIYVLKIGEVPPLSDFLSSPTAIPWRASRKAIFSLPHAGMSYKREQWNATSAY
ncbi:hypothetical protein [Candidatus Thiosymbion oneisti]|uniref:hypothetical protein n=1 Tax=Candidatus Thiosymbion oneisti TaxID=589554 RepID=UPI00106108E4|nr:hypothetical protein [Candidatus Thiosymbion oneisti]